MEETRAHTNKVALLHKELSYMIQGIVFDIRKDFGLEHKEQIYQKAFELALEERKIPFQREPAIKIFAPRSGDFVGLYRPDFLIDKKVIIELKAQRFLSSSQMKQLYDYLRNSEYELGYLINFAPPRAYIKRILHTNDRKSWFKKLLVVVSLVFVLVRGLPARAAELYFGADSREVAVGQTFEVGVFLNTDGEQVNAVEGSVTFSGDLLEVRDVYDGSSIIALWVERPTAVRETERETGRETDAKVRFSGIIPGGYVGGRGYLFSLIFKAGGAGQAVIATSDDRVLLNDGEGTPTELRRAPLTLIISEGPTVSEYIAPEDADPPEQFAPQIVQDPNVFDGQYFLVFATQDKQSGIDHYEIYETARIRTQKDTKEVIPRGRPEWTLGESPYLLQDQKLGSYVFVKAVDKAGNERIAVLSPERPLPWYKNYAIWGMIITGAAVLIYILRRVLIWRKKNTKHHE